MHSRYDSIACVILSENFCKAKIEVERSRELSIRKFTLKYPEIFFQFLQPPTSKFSPLAPKLTTCKFTKKL